MMMLSGCGESEEQTATRDMAAADSGCSTPHGSADESEDQRRLTVSRDRTNEHHLVTGCLYYGGVAPVIYVAYRPVLLDIQLLKTTFGWLIKELAYKSPTWSFMDYYIWPPPDRSMHYACYRHDPAVVLLNRMIAANGSYYDRYTGLAIDGGDQLYSDGHVLFELSRYNLILVKGMNKKRALLELYARNAEDGTGRERPKIVNIDSYTMDQEDAAFCNQHLVGGPAKFSFDFVYRRFSVYLKLAGRRNGYSLSDSPIYLNNVIIGDKRYDPLASGRPLWICPHDHTCGQTWFDTQRCAALNVGLLETLWFHLRDFEYRELLKFYRPVERTESDRRVHNEREEDFTNGESDTISLQTDGDRICTDNQRQRRQRRRKKGSQRVE